MTVHIQLGLLFKQELLRLKRELKRCLNNQNILKEAVSQGCELLTIIPNQLMERKI
jgi:hypothetical protein